MLGEVLLKCRAKSPLVHCITNYVTANDCANVLLACGASAIMADDPDEAAEITGMCAALTINLGTPSPRRIKAMLRAGAEAGRLGHPIVFDPVGAGCSRMRRDAAQRLLDALKIAVIRGNASEIAALAQGRMGCRGVDSDPGAPDPVENARYLARSYGAVVIVSGETDVVTDGHTTYRVMNGHGMMRSVTGAGCQLSALTGAYAAAMPGNYLHAALAAVCTMGLCGEIAHERLSPMDGNASYRNYIIDAIYRLAPEALERGARYEIYA